MFMATFGILWSENLLLCLPVTNAVFKEEQKNTDRRERKGALLKALEVSTFKTKIIWFFFSFSGVFRFLDRTLWSALASSFFTLCLTTSSNRAPEVATICRAEHPVALERWQAAGQTELHIPDVKGASSTSRRQCQRGFKTSINLLLAFLSLCLYGWV